MPLASWFAFAMGDVGANLSSPCALSDFPILILPGRRLVDFVESVRVEENIILECWHCATEESAEHLLWFGLAAAEVL